MKTKHTTLLSLVFIVGLWFFFCIPYFFQNRVPYPSTYQVNSFTPWSAYERFWGPVKNGAMPDVVGQLFPWRHFTITTWQSGNVPLWNPFSFSGTPHLANYQSAAYSPFTLLFMILPFVDAWSLLVLLQPLLAGLGMFLFLRQVSVNKLGSLLGSISFMFCGFMVTWMAYGTLSMAIAFLPLTLFAIEKFIQTGERKYCVLQTVCIFSSFFSGHFQTSLYLLIYVFSYLMYRCYGLKKEKVLPLLIAFMAGVGVSLLQIVPSIEFYFASVRSEKFISEGGIPWKYLVTLVAPDFYGNPTTRNDWFGYYAEWASFIGIIPFCLSIIALFRKNSFILFFTVVAVVSLLLAIDSPLQKGIGFLHIPVLSTSNPNRIIVLFSFSLSVLSGFGLNILEDYIKRRNGKILFAISLAGVIIATYIGIVFFATPFTNEQIAIAQRNIILPFILFCLFVSTVLMHYIKNSSYTWAFLACVLLLCTSFDSIRFVQKWMPFDPKTLVFPQTAIIEGIQKHIGYGRIFGNISGQVDTYYGFPSIEGYDPLYIQRYGEFVRSAATGHWTEGERSVVTADRHGKYIDRLLDVLGISLVFHPKQDTNTSWAYPVWQKKDKYSIVYQDEKFQLFTNKTALDRATLFYNYEIKTKKEEIIERFYDTSFDFRTTMLLEEDPHILKNQNGKGKVMILSYTPNKVRLKVESNADGLLFLSDNYYPGWKATITKDKNVSIAKIYRANYSFRGIVIPEGTSFVEFTYTFL